MESFEKRLYQFQAHRRVDLSNSRSAVFEQSEQGGRCFRRLLPSAVGSLRTDGFESLVQYLFAWPLARSHQRGDCAARSDAGTRIEVQGVRL